MKKLKKTMQNAQHPSLKILVSCAMACVILLALACVPSLHPLYESEKDLVWDPALVGQWRDDATTWAFSVLDPESDKPLAYKLIITDKDGKMQGNLEARLVKLGENRFLDTAPGEFEIGDYNAFHAVPAHLIWQLRSTSPTLQMHAMNPDWLDTFDKENPGKIAVERLEDEDRVVLRAKPKDLQAFVLQHLEEDTLFSKYGREMTRVEAPAAKKE